MVNAVSFLHCDYPHDVGKCDTRHRKTLRQSIIGHASRRDQMRRCTAMAQRSGTLLLNCEKDSHTGVIDRAFYRSN